MIMNKFKSNTYVSLLFILGINIFYAMTLEAQVKIGDNHASINAGSLLELESTSKGLMFPRVALEDDLSIWALDGTAMDGMVVFNTDTTINPEGLYCWYNAQWNHFSSGGNQTELDSLSFNTETRLLYDDGDSVRIPSGIVNTVNDTSTLQGYLTSNLAGEGDIFYLPGDGVYIRNNVTEATTVGEGYVFIPTNVYSGRILYANFESEPTDIEDLDAFSLAMDDTFYTEPDTPRIISVDPPSVAAGEYYAFAIPNNWGTPLISLKVRNSSDKGYYKLDDCWSVSRQLEHEGLLYQVWTLDVPMRETVMDIVDGKAQFMIE